MKFHSELLNYIDIPVMDIHGKQKQQKRTTSFFQFCKEDKGILLCTDVAARGQTDYAYLLCLPTHIYSYKYLFIHTYIYLHTYSYILTYIHSYIHIFLHTYIHS